MMSEQKMGPRLTAALSSVDYSDNTLFKSAAADFGAETSDDEVGGAVLPVVLKTPTNRPRRHEPWSEYRERTREDLANIARRLHEESGIRTQPLVAANSLSAYAAPGQIWDAARNVQVDMIELDSLLYAESLDDVSEDIEFPTFQTRHPNLDGNGVTLAVLDSGIDLSHPLLSVSNSVSTCGEDVRIPGSHGTHCAGIIASRDRQYRGIAPAVELLNVKVLTASGGGTQTSITRGVDEALDLGANILTMSLGFNHLPTWSNGGHGWSCSRGHCPLCTAVDNAASLDDVLVVVAAGNEHERAEALRQQNQSASFDTEICCPGNARLALTVGAITKRTYIPAAFSSVGPTPDRRVKHVIVAPGVNIMSTIPVPRDGVGNALPRPQRSQLFGRKSGTSMATPLVAGAAALVIQALRQNGISVGATRVRAILSEQLRVAMPDPATIVGQGRLDLAGFSMR